MKILAIVGSLRKESLNRSLAELAAQAVGERAAVEILDYSAAPLFNEDDEFPAPDAVSAAREKVKGASGLWFFSPEYNHFFSGALKNLIDWLSRPAGKDRPQVLAGKPAALSGVTPGMSGTGIGQDHLVTLLSFLNMRIMNAPRLTIPNALSQTENGRLTLGASAEYLRKQADAFVEFIEKYEDGGGKD